MSVVGLSEPAASVWAKSPGSDGAWLPLWRHLEDAAAVAGRLWDAWLPDSVRQLVGAALPGGVADGQRLVMWLAGVHDIGKATPAFAVQNRRCAGRMESCGLRVADRRDPACKDVPHGTAGLILLERWLQDHYGWQPRESRPLTVVLGGHHGVPPTDRSLVAARTRPRLLGLAPGQDLWRAVHGELLDRMAGVTGICGRLAAWRTATISQPIQVLLTAIVIVADWLASNEGLFSYDTDRFTDPSRVSDAWRSLDLPGPWRARDEGHDAARVFAARFTLPDGARPRPVQERALDLARRMPLPGLMIVEAPMGEGKTELAFAVAEVMAARTGAGGCYVALPTMATSNAMFPRLLDWLGCLPADGNLRRTVRLAHSRARFEDVFIALFRYGDARSVDLDGSSGAELIVHRWLTGRKGPFASFAVGTIDQLLFAALKTRYLVMRHLGLAGKVVIVDEVHAADTYMSEYLDRALHWLGAYGVPTILLSSTLPARRRRQMLAAYEAGRGAGTTGAADGVAVTGSSSSVETSDYPVLVATGAPGAAPMVVPVAASGRGAEVSVARLDDDLDALGAVLREILSDGGCVAVVRNTVRRVQETAAYLRTAFDPAEVTVAHSRFLAPDRAAKDRWLRKRFGPPGEPGGDAAHPRPYRHIVVGSQVIEQSLDIDFDMMVSDLAPVDLLLQRLGRVHRHPRGEGQSGRPVKLRRARCLVTGADWTAEPPRPVAGSRQVYGLHLLLRTLAVLEPILGDGVISLPGDISPLVQAVYGEEAVGPPAWQPQLADALAQDEQKSARRRDEAGTYLLDPVATGRPGRATKTLVNWLDVRAGDVEDDTARGRATVRDSDGGEDVVVVVRRADGTIVTPPWLASDGGLEVPTDARPDDRLGRIVARCTLSLPRAVSHPGIVDRTISELKALSFVGWQESKWLAGALVLVLNENGRATLAGHDLHYDPRDGLLTTKRPR